MIMTELCQELKNWFNRDQKTWHGKFVISDGNLTSPDWTLDLLDGQFFRIIGSALNDGVHRKGFEEDALQDESFSGSIWAMAVPPSVIALSEEIEEWQNKYGTVDSAAMSPYSSESFGGYSYAKAGRGSGWGGSGSSNTNPTWKSIFSDRLNRWRKI